MATTRTFATHMKAISPWQAIITSAFHAQSMREVTVDEAYYLAADLPTTTITDEPLYRPERYNLPPDARVLLCNDGEIVGRTAKARRLVADFTPAEVTRYQTIVREAVYKMTEKPCIKATAVVGLDPHYMVRAHFATPEHYAMDVFNWLINFTPYEHVADVYADSRPIDGFDIHVLSDPDWEDPRHDGPVVIFDPSRQVAIILGLRYFGEKKKATLTLAWSLGVDLGMVACHAGVKEVRLNEGDGQVEHSISFFGLSGSGKSSLTNNKSHLGLIREDEGEYVKIVHDDAFVVDIDNNKVVALEPTLFDKTDSVWLGDDDIKYWLTAQNQAVDIVDGQVRILPGDIRNKNGRAIKSRDWIGNIHNTCARPESICWLMKDQLLPPIVWLDDPNMAVAMGACLSTKRTAAENVSPEEMKKLIVEPFANPFRVYPLARDCERFKALFDKGCSGYILNTGNYRDQDIPKELSLELVVKILRGQLEYQDWLPGMKILKPGIIDDMYTPPTDDTAYWEQFDKNCQSRLDALASRKAPGGVVQAIQTLRDFIGEKYL